MTRRFWLFVSLGCAILGAAVSGQGIVRAGSPLLGSPRVAVVSSTKDDLPVPPRLETALQEELAMEAALQSASVPERDLRDLAIRLKRAPADVPRVVRTAPLPRQIGDQQAFWVSDQTAHNYFKTTATLRYITPHVYMWVENGYNTPDEAIRQAADRFENSVYPVARQSFGSEWHLGIDGDPHISIFNGFVPGVGGYYSSNDEFCNLVNPYSNEMEMFYINLDNATPGTDYYNGILAHEFQHMIHWNSDRNEETWLNEGLAELSAQVNGLEASGSLGAFLGHPDTALTSWPDSPRQAGANYGASHSFANYLFQRFGGDFIKALVAEKENGLTGIDRVLQSRHAGTEANAVFADWVIANYLGDPNAAPDGRFGFRASAESMAVDATHDAYPVERSTDVRQYGTDYIVLDGTGDLQIDFEGATRVKLTNNEPHSGKFMWWSNRGDDSDMTLTRAFDLTGLKAATLEFWLWYDIERDWDYAYVEVSTDGGHTWDLLRGAHSSDENPNGNSFGWAYTGSSGGGDAPVWVQERIDLTPYAGQKALVRFEYVTDDAVNRAGLCVDDIAVPELGYVDDAETDTGGWETGGFIRSSNSLRQQFLLQVIEFGPTVRVRRVGGPVAVAEAPQPVSPAMPADLERALASVECQPYEVQADDSLWSLAAEHLGNGAALDVLLAATNARHETDASYVHIEDARSIRRGARLCLPANEDARREMLALRGQIPAAKPAPVSSPEALATGSQQFTLSGLGKDIERAVLVVSAIAPVTAEVAPYRYTVTPLP